MKEYLVKLRSKVNGCEVEFKRQARNQRSIEVYYEGTPFEIISIKLLP